MLGCCCKTEILVFELEKEKRTFVIYCNKLADHRKKIKLKGMFTMKNHSLAFKALFLATLALHSISFWNQTLCTLWYSWLRVAQNFKMEGCFLGKMVGFTDFKNCSIEVTQKCLNNLKDVKILENETFFPQNMVVYCKSYYHTMILCLEFNVSMFQSLI